MKRPMLPRPFPIRRDKFAHIIGIGRVAALPLFWLARFDGIPILTFALAMAVFYASTLPLIRWARSGSTAIPMLALICLFYGIYTGFGAIIQPNVIILSSTPHTIDWRFVNKALILSGLGLVVLIATLAGLKRLRPASGFRIDLRIPQERRVTVIFGLAIAAIVVKFFAQGWLPVGGHVQLSERMLLCSVALAALYYYRYSDRGVAVRAGLLVLLIYVSLTGLSSGMLEAAVSPLLTVFIIRTAARKRFPTLLFFLAVSVLFLLNAVKGDYRERVTRGEHGGSYREQINLWRTSFMTYDYRSFIRPDPNAEAVSGLRASLGRFSIVSRAAWVCENTPERTPYLMGESYKPFLYAPIPRLLWPNKPMLSDVLTHIDLTYGFIEGEVNAAFGIGYIGEGYANFGIFGVVVVMLFQGVVLYFLDSMLNRPDSEGGAAIFTVLLIGMLNGIGSSLIIIYGNLLQMLVACVLVIHVARMFGASSTGGTMRLAARPSLRASP